MWWLLTACAPAERTIGDREDAWAERMATLDARALEARDAVAQGDLGAARRAGAALRQALPPEGVPPRLVAGLDALDAAATPRDAAGAVAELATGCLQCHAEQHASLAGREAQPLRRVEGVLPAEMERHRVFVDAVWLGLIGGDDAPLHQAAAFLDQGGLVAGTPARRDPSFALGAAAAALDARAHAVAGALRDAPADQRPARFAELLVTCADCHALARTREGLAARPDTPREPKMNDHFLSMLRFELAVIGGDVPAARRAAGELEQAEITAPPAAEPHLRALREEAARAGHMDRVASLADSAGTLLAACGACHRATEGGPRAAVEPAPTPADPEMKRHLYASFWMGQGLLSGDDAAWRAGAAALAADGVGPFRGDPAAEVAVHALAARAERAATDAERADVFGELLATCSPCHVAARR